MKEYDILLKGRKPQPMNVMGRRTSDNFQKKIHYVEDAYERKEDMKKVDYQRRASLILDKSRPYNSSVKQHGTFDSFRKTYGTDGIFPTKPSWTTKKPAYGPFRLGDPAKTGYNSRIGPNPPYMEDPLEDSVAYQKDIKRPIWRDPTHTTSMPFNPMSRSFKNTGGIPLKTK